MKNKINQLFNIQYPIIQAGMIWNSGWRLASAVSNAGGLGLLGAGSMYPEVLREHIQKVCLTVSFPRECEKISSLKKLDISIFKRNSTERKLTVGRRANRHTFSSNYNNNII